MHMVNKIIEVHDNNLSKEVVDMIRDKIMDSTMMDWYYSDSTVTNKIDGQYDSNQMIHLVLDDGVVHSNLLDTVSTLVVSSGKAFSGIFRIKINMLLGNNLGCKKHNTPHKDADEKHFSILYYVNDSDGDTIFFDDDGKEFKRVSPKSGRMVIFDSDILHASTPPNDGRRVIINCILNKIDTTM